ncbi:MAG: hypothetical protein AAF492_00600, partial [Verrucomicrobiota bacterium]
NAHRCEVLADRFAETPTEFNRDLHDWPSPAHLRRYWKRGGYLESGVLFAKPHQPDQGVLELLALSRVCEIYKRVSGTFTKDETSQKDGAESTQQLVIGSDREPNGLPPLVSRLTGGLVGVGVDKVGAGSFEATVSGLMAAIGAAMVFKFTSTQSQTRSVEREQTFERDRTIATLYREVPNIIMALMNAGLAPIFVVDELDKIDEPHVINELLDGLKNFFSEEAFFCFLTGRDYFEHVQRKILRFTYPPEYTYFSKQLFVVFKPKDFHAYLNQALSPEGAREETDAARIPYILLHQSRMHPIALRRRLDAISDEEGRLKWKTGWVLDSRSCRIDLMVQVAVELLLDDPELTERLDREPAFRRLVYDTLYYISRRLIDGVDELSLEEDSFLHYLVVERSTELGQQEENGGGLSREEKIGRIGSSNFEALLDLAREHGQLLADADRLKGRVERWQNSREADPPLVRDIFEFMLRLEPVDMLLRKTSDAEDAYVYAWQYDQYGAPQFTRGKESGPGLDADWRLLKNFAAAIGTLSGGRLTPDDLVFEFDLFTPDSTWEGLQELMAELDGDGPEEADGATHLVSDYADMLRKNRSAISSALFCGLVLGKVVGVETLADPALELGRALEAMARLYGLEERSDEAREKVLADGRERFMNHFDVPSVAIAEASDEEPFRPGWVDGLLNAVKTHVEIDPHAIDVAQRDSWTGWEVYLLSHPVSRKAQVTPIVEDLICAVLERRPADLIEKDLGRMTVGRWSEAVYWSWMDIGETDPRFCPGWVAAAALNAMSLFPDRSSERFEAFRDADASYDSRTDGSGFSEGINRILDGGLVDDRGALPRVLIVTRDSGSLMAEWTTEPVAAGLILSAAQCLDLIDQMGLQRFYQRLGFEWVAYELTVNSVTNRDMKELSTRLKRIRRDHGVLEVDILRRSPGGRQRKLPYIMAPNNVEDFFDQLAGLHQEANSKPVGKKKKTRG